MFDTYLNAKENSASNFRYFLFIYDISQHFDNVSLYGMFSDTGLGASQSKLQKP